MRRDIVVVLVGLLVLCGVAGTRSAMAGQLYVKYYPSKATKHQREYAAQRTLEDALGLVNGIINPNSLSRDVEVAVEDCGQVNAFYSPTRKRITICYELLDFLLSTSQKIPGDSGERGRAFYQMAHFIVLHEVGHMFQDILKRGGLGNRESEADYFAAVVAISAGKEGAEMAANGSLLFMTWSKGQVIRFNDEHPPAASRAYDIMCLVYGSKPKEYSALGVQLGDARRRRCAAEYQPTFQAWKKHLQPVLVGGGSGRQ